MKKIRFLCCMVLATILVSFCIGDTSVQAKKGEASLVMSSKKSSLKVGKTYQYKVTYISADGTKEVVPGKKVTWTVSDKNLATIKTNGTLKPKRVGTVKITAQYQGEKVSTKVKITGKAVIGVDAGHQQKGNSAKEAVGPGATTMKAKVASGTTGVSSKVPEYKVTLEIATQLEEELWKRGYEVVMTRTSNDVDISNKERALLLNERCDVGIRLHCDGTSSSSVRGASVLYTSTKNLYVESAISKKSKVLSETIIDEYCTVTGIKNRGGSLRDDLTGNNWSTIPTVVLEMGFMSNAQEDQWMQKDTNQKKMVKGIADGIDAYYGK